MRRARCGGGGICNACRHARAHAHRTHACAQAGASQKCKHPCTQAHTHTGTPAHTHTCTRNRSPAQTVVTCLRRSSAPRGGGLRSRAPSGASSRPSWWVGHGCRRGGRGGAAAAIPQLGWVGSCICSLQHFLGSSQACFAIPLCHTQAALEHMHGLGILHRDIKPENILLARRRRGAKRPPPAAAVAGAGIGGPGEAAGAPAACEAAAGTPEAGEAAAAADLDNTEAGGDESEWGLQVKVAGGWVCYARQRLAVVRTPLQAGALHVQTRVNMSTAFLKQPFSLCCRPRRLAGRRFRPQHLHPPRAPRHPRRHPRLHGPRGAALLVARLAHIARKHGAARRGCPSSGAASTCPAVLAHNMAPPGPQVLVCPDKKLPSDNKDKAAALAYGGAADVW